jgi:phosphatidylinositol alpha-1,6-mannosyltransferase
MPGLVTCRSRVSAVLRALTLSRKPKLVLVWHLSLLKLLPMLDTSEARIVVYLHGIEAWQPLRGMVGKQLPNVHSILTNSDYTWKRFVRANPGCSEIPHQTVPLGIGSPVDRIAVPRDPPTAVMISRLNKTEDYKGHREVLSVWKIVQGAVPRARLQIVGRGELTEDLRRESQRQGLNGTVQFLGWVEEGEKAELIESSRCLLLPSRAEGFGLVYLEAMREGRPCLVSGLDGGTEVVNPPEAGLAADPSRPTDLSQAIISLMSPSAAWKQWSENARRRYELNFTARLFVLRLKSALGL